MSKYTDWDKRFEKEDLWQFKTNPWQKERFEQTVAMLPDYDKALDIGCMEGEFTKYLKGNVLGVDVSQVAVDRAKKKFPALKFKKLDIEEEKLEQKFDLITVMETLYYLADQVAVKDRIVSMMTEGGYLVLEHVLESACNGKEIARPYHQLYRDDKRLHVVAEKIYKGPKGSESYEILLLQKSDPIKVDYYTEEYFLNHNSGFTEWKAGQRDAGRFKKLFELAGVQKGDWVLDIGCGRGELAYLCGKAGADVVAMDYSPDAVKLAQQTVQGVPNVSVLRGDVKQIPIAKYDHIFCLDVLEHLWDWEIAALVKRLKQCGGTFWGYTSPEKNWALQNRPDDMGDAVAHINCHTQDSITRLFDGAWIKWHDYHTHALTFSARW